MIINVNKFYQERLYKYLTKEEFWQEKHRFVPSWVEKNLGRKPDLEQSVAIGEVNNNIQVLARAGSGKTSTLVHKALFLQKHYDLRASFTRVDDFFNQSSWYAIADGVEVCFYDDFRNLLCVCHVNNGQHDYLKAPNIELYSQDLEQ